VRNPAAFQAATKLARHSDAANPFAVVPDGFERGQVASAVCWLNATISKATGSFHREPSRLASRPGACFREGKISRLPCRFGNAKLLPKKLLASPGRAFMMASV